MSVKQELIKAKALIADPKNWTQSCLARNAGDMFVNVNDQIACKFCALGALRKAGTHEDAYMKLADAAFKAGFSGIAALNDFGLHEDVMEIFDKAIEEAS